MKIILNINITNNFVYWFHNIKIIKFVKGLSFLLIDYIYMFVVIFKVEFYCLAHIF